MKQIYFAATACAVSFCAGVISGDFRLASSAGFALWLLLKSIDAIFNPVITLPRPPAVPGDCEGEI